MARFAADRGAAREAKDPMAAVCVLATVDEGGLPQARTLVLRDIPEGLALYVNASSPKWEQTQKQVAVHVWWPSIQIQYRIQARCEALPAEHIAESWQLRPDVPKWRGGLEGRLPQGGVGNSREDLLNALENTNPPTPLVAPEGARGLLLVPEKIERLDLNQANGVHDRTQYELDAGRWLEHTLIP